MHVNWLSPVKVRQFLVGGAAQLVYNDLEPSEKVRSTTAASSLDAEGIHADLVDYRSGDCGRRLEPANRSGRGRALRRLHRGYGRSR